MNEKDKLIIDKKIEVEGEENPPLFKTWKSWYALVLGNLIFLITLFYFFTKVFD